MHFCRFGTAGHMISYRVVVPMGYHIAGDAFIHTRKQENITYKICIQCFSSFNSAQKRRRHALFKKKIIKLSTQTTSARRGKTNAPNQSSAFFLHFSDALLLVLFLGTTDVSVYNLPRSAPVFTARTERGGGTLLLSASIATRPLNHVTPTEQLKKP